MRDAVESLTVFKWDIIGYMFATWFVVYAASVISRYVLKLHVGRDNFAWQMATIVLDNDCVKDYAANTMRVLISTVIVGVFYVVQYYGGYFSTDLVVAAKPFKIDDLKDLAASGKVPMWVRLDAAIYDYQLGKTTGHRLVWQRHLENQKLEHNDPRYIDNLLKVSEEDPNFFSRIIGLLTQHKAAMISIRGFQRGINYAYCHRELGITEKPNFRSTFHLSKPFDHTTYGSLFHPNASREVLQRYHCQLIKLLEGGNMIQKYIFDVIEMYMAEYVMNLDMQKLEKCVNGYQADQNADDIVLRITNITLLIKYSFYAIAFNFVVLAFEVAVNFVLERKCRKRRKLKEIVKRVILSDSTATANPEHRHLQRVAHTQPLHNILTQIA